MFQLLTITDYLVETHLPERFKRLVAVMEMKPTAKSPCLRDYILQSPPQLIFIDIDLKKIQEINKLPDSIRSKILWVGITKEYEVGFKALQQGFFDVLLPFSPEKLVFLMERLMQKLLSKERPITISCPKEKRYLNTSAILYIKADNNYVNIQLDDGECFSVFNTLSHFQEVLLFPFFRVHKSYIVNAHHISRIHFTKRFIKLKGCGHFIPYSSTYTDQLEEIEILKRYNVM